MSDYLAHLVARTLAPAPGIRPQTPALFEPPSIAPEPAVPHEFNAEKAAALSTVFATAEKNPGASKGKSASEENSPGHLRMKTQPAPAPNIIPLHPPSAAPPREEIVVRHVHSGRNWNDSFSEPSRPEREMSAAARAPSPSFRSRRTGEPESGQKISGTKPLALPGTPVAVPSRLRESEKDFSIRPVSPRERREPPVASAPAAPAEPVINVTIGRVEIRAVQNPARERSQPKAPRGLSLDDYLRQRAGGISR